MTSDPAQMTDDPADDAVTAGSGSPDGSRSGRRKAGVTQGVCLLLAAMLPAMGVTLVSPNIPVITEIFGGQPGGAYLVSIAVTVPSLVIAITSGLVGLLVDRFGRRVCLLTALALYAAFGTAPAFSTSLTAFVVLRGLLGLVEAVIMTSSLALIADYWRGEDRSRWLAYSTGFTAVASIVVYSIAGFLGELGWQYPFFFYLIAVLIFVYAIVVIWEPSRDQLVREDAPASVGLPSGSGGAAPAPRLLTAPFVTALVLAVVGGALFFVVPLQIAEYFAQHGTTSPALIGTLIAVATVGNAIGALGFRFVAHFPSRYLVVGSMTVSAVGLILLQFSTTATTITAAAFVNQLGAGMFPPLFMAITMGLAPALRRGRAGGLFWSTFSIGNFSSPLIMVAVTGAVGSLGVAFVAAAVVSLVIAVLAATPPAKRVLRSTPRPVAEPGVTTS